MWSSGPASQGQFSGKAWREQVITRQPAAEKRLTVAWPMPRLAPVRSRVRRGWLSLCVIIFQAYLKETTASSPMVHSLCYAGIADDHVIGMAGPARTLLQVG